MMKMRLYIPLFFMLALLACFSVMAQEPATEATEAEQDTAEEEQKPAQSQRPPASAPRPRVPKTEQAFMSMLVEQLDLNDGALTWLESQNEEFLAYWQRDRSGYPKGALLIIHGEGESVVDPALIKPLHNTLPDYGWATLSINLPAPDRRAIPERTLPVKVPYQPQAQEQNEAAAEGEDETAAESEAAEKTKEVAPPKPAAKKILSETESLHRLESALTFLHDQGQFNIIVLGSGIGAIRAQNFITQITPKIENPRLKANFEKPVRALIMINGRNQLPIEKTIYGGWFADPEIPILDVFVATDRRNLVEAKARKVMAKQKKVLVYKQVRLPATLHEHAWGETPISRRVRSFLDTNAVGVEVKNARLRR